MKMTGATFNLAAVFIVVALLLGCSEKSEDNMPAAEQGYADVVLKVTPDKPVALRDTTFTAIITDEHGRALEGAEVVFDLSMPGMYHGENRPAGTEVEPGVYRGTGILTMAGNWRVMVEVKAPGLDVMREFFVTAVGG